MRGIGNPRFKLIKTRGGGGGQEMMVGRGMICTGAEECGIKRAVMMGKEEQGAPPRGRIARARRGAATGARGTHGMSVGSRGGKPVRPAWSGGPT